MELTPAMQQYVNIKKDYPSSILLFRMGDFYETFYDDAKDMSLILGITLTKRGTTNPVPLAGIPYHSLDNYLQKLVAAGRTVTIIEQMEDPKLAKGRLVKRDVSRTISPGTIIDFEFLDSKTNNYICSLKFGDEVCISYSDLSTGELKLFTSTKSELINDLVKLSPAEIIISESELTFLDSYRKVLKSTITPLAPIYFSPSFCQDVIKEQLSVLSTKSFGIENNDAYISSLGALLYYFKHTQKVIPTNIRSVKITNKSDYMTLDLHTVKNLEIVSSLDSDSKSSLFSVIDRTATPMGARYLKKALLSPLQSKSLIIQRQDIISTLIKRNLHRNINALLIGIQDVERLLSRLMYSNAGPRDLVALSASLARIRTVKEFIDYNEISDLGFEYSDNIARICTLINKAIIDEPPLLFRDGGFIKRGFSTELDNLFDLTHNTKKVILELEEKERVKTGIKSLKISYNRVFGYFIEIPKSQSNLVPQNYVRKQTLAQYERYIVEDLKNLEDSILSAQEKSKVLELEIFNEVLIEVRSCAKEVYLLSDNISLVDFMTSAAILATQNAYVKPDLNDDGVLTIEGGRHPVIESSMKSGFISNDLALDSSKRTIILTGPNMAGKSTYLRQNALIILLAHTGLYVPCSFANIPITDRIFTRIGAHDNLSLGLSTFMVEMIETANILNNATSKSFVILDEIGRGTSTYDGMSIAQSVLEYVTKNIGAKTIFATHYHQITRLESELPGVLNYHISAKEVDGNLIFLRKVEKGSVDKSFGIAVAKLAGLPLEVTRRAEEIELNLEKENLKSENKNLQRKLFG